MVATKQLSRSGFYEIDYILSQSNICPKDSLRIWAWFKND